MFPNNDLVRSNRAPLIVCVEPPAALWSAPHVFSSPSSLLLSSASQPHARHQRRHQSALQRRRQRRHRRRRQRRLLRKHRRRLLRRLLRRHQRKHRRRHQRRHQRRPHQRRVRTKGCAEECIVCSVRLVCSLIRATSHIACVDSRWQEGWWRSARQQLHALDWLMARSTDPRHATPHSLLLFAHVHAC